MPDAPRTLSLELDPDWQALDPKIVVGEGSFVSGDPDGDRIRVRYAHPSAGTAAGLVAKVWFGPLAKGPPGHAHGGSTAAVLDEAMGLSAWSAGHAVVAARITIEYRQLVPLERVHRLWAHVEKVDGKRVLTKGAIEDAEGRLLVGGTGVFVVLGLDRFGALEEVARRARRSSSK